MAKENGYTPTPDDLRKLRESVDVLVNRGAVRDDARRLLKVLEDKDSWGLPDDYVAASKRSLKGFMSRPYIFPEDVEDLVGAFDQEQKFAYVDWAKKRETAAQVGRKIKRVVQSTARVAIIVLGTSYLGYFGYQGISTEVAAQNSPEAVAKKQAEKMQWEQSHTLDLGWTQESAYHWRFKYPPFDPNIDYIDSNYKNSSKLITSGNRMIVAPPPEDQSIVKGIFGDIIPDDDFYASISPYTKLDGNVVPKITVITPGGSNNQEVILRNEPMESMETRVVYAYNTDKQKERYLKVSVGGKDSVQVSVVKPVKRQN